MSFDDEDGPLWKRVLFNEFLLAVVAILIVLGVAFALATKREPKDEFGNPVKRDQTVPP